MLKLLSSTRTALFLVAAAAFAAPVPVVQNQIYRLPVGKNYFTIYQSTDGTSCTSSSNATKVMFPSGWTRARVHFQQSFYKTTPTVDSADPAEFCWDFTKYNNGNGIRYMVEQLD